MRNYRFRDLPIDIEYEISEWLYKQSSIAYIYSYERTGSGDIVSIFEIDFTDAKIETLFLLLWGDIMDAYNRR